MLICVADGLQNVLVLVDLLGHLGNLLGH